MRFDVRLSAKVPHASHHCTVPDMIKLCLLPLLTGLPSMAAATVARGFAPVPLHLEVASFAHEVDLVLHRVQSQQWPDKANSMVCPPLADGMTFFSGFDPLLFLPSIPAFLSALFLWAATALHLEASESRKGKRGWLPAAWVAIPIHFALAFAASNAFFHLRTSSCGTRWCSTPSFASLSAMSLPMTSALGDQ